MHYLLIYEVTPDYLTRRADFRAEHLALAWESVERGELLLGGALSDPADGAVLLFQADSPDVATNFALTDPYVKQGLVSKWSVRAWNTVVGHQASNPLQVG